MLLIFNAATDTPVVDGAKAALIEQTPPGARVAVQVFCVTTKLPAPAPVMLLG